ncbi:nuclear factor NF-kappa-B p100 subunit-like isoform X3 [Brienomyrus brachyistius]|nr:nuclear factor NF-kappa-B p100 subunit-like isoform X3 [Brienomyrus brachyistius]
MIENEFMMDFPYSFVPSVKSEPYLSDTANGPYLQIIEEPKQRGFRFRYECEGPSHGGLPGASSEKNKKTYPTVKVCNYMGYARVEVQLVTHMDPPRVHAHSLVGKHCNDSGMCSMEVGPTDLTAQFNNLGILHITKKAVFEVLSKRLREEKLKLKGPNYHLTDTEEQEILKEAKELGNKMDLNVVRLKFTAYLQDGDGGYTRALKPAISKPIYDSKSPNASNLKISRMDKTCGSVLGGDEIFLLCDKVQKDDIDIRFFEEDKEGAWEDFGDFSPTDVHKQYAIVFKTPKYHTPDIERPVTVFLQLKRRKGNDCSEPKQFTYVPHVQDKEEVQRKKKKPLPHSFDPWNGPPGGAAGTGRGPGSFGGSGRGGNGGFPFNPQLDMGFNSMGTFMGNGTRMAASVPAPSTPADQQEGSRVPPGGPPLQQQLLQIASMLQNRATQTTRRTARALLDYCSTGDVCLLLAVQRQLYSVQDENGDTPLHLAIIHQQPAVVQQLVYMISTIPQQQILNIRNHMNQTPLHLAVITKQPKVLDFLLKAGADPTLVDRDGRTVLHLAADIGDEFVLRILLTHLKENYGHLFNTADYHGLYPLHLAVKKGGERCLRALVLCGARVNAVELKSGNTALHLAVRENLFKVACMLITELKADVNASTFCGNTPLHLAASLGSPTLCSMLIAAGARKDLENDEPLFLSSSDEEDDDKEDEAVEEMGMQQQTASSPSEVPKNPRKRAGGHTPLDLARCQKVRAILDSRESDRPSREVPKPSEKQEEAKPQMDSETLSKLCGILSQSHVPLRQLAEKLGMLTLADLYQKSPSPCQHLLENYQLGGGQLETLVEALQSLGLNEGVKLLRQTELRDKAQSTGIHGCIVTCVCWGGSLQCLRPGSYFMQTVLQQQAHCNAGLSTMPNVLAPRQAAMCFDGRPGVAL